MNRIFFVENLMRFNLYLKLFLIKATVYEIFRKYLEKVTSTPPTPLSSPYSRRLFTARSEDQPPQLCQVSKIHDLFFLFFVRCQDNVNNFQVIFQVISLFQLIN
ncbi:hypothetical protein O3M35_012302 [Rhynocoris fuscipes]|uniref:Uncharacterized protein n=1 Tax=Rhynocoris fuscipes TaxID=488301 RepID=A0AAW1CRW4_9HEMI